MFIETGRGFSYDTSYGATCNSCLKGNFRGRRFKCLICYDYDLCKTCYEAGTTTTCHTTEHPMQCILTVEDYNLYYGAEAVLIGQTQSFTCAYCGKLGFTIPRLQEHVTTEHKNICFEVVCPVCAGIPNGDPNYVTDDFAAHLTYDHCNPPRDLISFLEDPQPKPKIRRIPAPTSKPPVSSSPQSSNIYLSKNLEPQHSEGELEKAEEERGDRNLFISQLMLLALNEAGTETPTKLRAELDSILNPSTSTSTDETKMDKDDVNTVIAGTSDKLKELDNPTESIGSDNITEESKLNQTDILLNQIRTINSTTPRAKAAATQLQASPRRKAHRSFTTDQTR